MQKVVHRAEDRGVATHGWLNSRFSFSFADWYEETRMGFGALRVINDDTVAPSSGFPMHPHRDMEIVTIVTKGAVTHQDSMGNRGTVSVGEVQVMSAGTGVVHSEYNESATEALELFQIWIFPNILGVEPQYGQRAFPPLSPNELTLLVGPRGTDAPLTVNQEACISRLLLTGTMEYALHREGNGVYAFVIDGEAEIEGEHVTLRDAVGVWDATSVALSSREGAELLLIEVPVE